MVSLVSFFLETIVSDQEDDRDGCPEVEVKGRLRSTFSGPERCHDTCTHKDFTCVHTRSDEQLMRISHAPFGVHVAEREVLVWRGPVSEIWDHGTSPSAP